jgi:Fe-S-cluster containining protein
VRATRGAASAADAVLQPNPCTTCGACCAFSREWPRFSVETEADIQAIPVAFVGERGMRCDGNRCSALEGRVGVRTSCTIYDVRPEVCRSCLPGDAECNIAREAFGLAAIVGAWSAMGFD